MPPHPGPISSGENAEEILVLVSGPDGHTDSVALHFLAEIRRALPKFAPSAVWIGANPNDLDRRQAQRSGAERGFHVPVSSDFVASRVAAAGFGRLLERRPQAAGAVFSADPFGREVAGQVAAQRGLGLTGDAVGMKACEDGSLRWLKPVFGGGIIADTLLANPAEPRHDASRTVRAGPVNAPRYVPTWNQSSGSSRWRD